MKILVAGGSGMIGQALTSDLASRGHEVWVLSRSPEEARLANGIHAARWDAKTSEGWENLAEEADAIINLAGANIGARPWTNERKRVIRESRVNAGRAIVEAVRRSARESARKPRAVLQIAGSGYYGVHGDEPLDENDAPGKDYLAGVAVDWEESTKPVAELGVRHVIMRTGVVLTPKGGVLAPFVLQNQLFAGGPLGSGKQWLSWIHYRDLVRAITFLLECEASPEAGGGVFNVTSPNPLTNAEFGRAVSKVMRRPFWLPAPAFMLRLVLGEMSTLVLDGQRVLPKRLLEMGFRFDFGEPRKALEDLLRKG